LLHCLCAASVFLYLLAAGYTLIQKRAVLINDRYVVLIKSLSISGIQTIQEVLFMNVQRMDGSVSYATIFLALLMLTVFICKPVFADDRCEQAYCAQGKHTQSFERCSADLHNQLQLTDLQEDDWNRFIQKMCPVDQSLTADGSGVSSLPAPERMERLLAIRKEGLERMEARAQAVKEFYTHLTTEQRQIFDATFRPDPADQHG
jgi:hypothetical protein